MSSHQLYHKFYQSWPRTVNSECSILCAWEKEICIFIFFYCFCFFYRMLFDPLFVFVLNNIPLINVQHIPLVFQQTVIHVSNIFDLTISFYKRKIFQFRSADIYSTEQGRWREEWKKTKIKAEYFNPLQCLWGIYKMLNSKNQKDLPFQSSWERTNK